MPKDAYYFPHDAGARNDPKILRLRRKHGHAGIGIYWHVIEMLREANGDGYRLRCNQMEDIAYDGRFEPAIFNDFIDDMELLQSDGDYFWSESLIRRMSPLDERRRKLSEAGKKGGRPKGKARVKPPLKQVKASPKPTESNKSRVEESKEDKTRDLALTAPTPKKPPKQKKRGKYPPRFGVEVWLAYKRGYMAKYGVEPKRNAKQSNLCCQLRDRLGLEDAVGVAEWYPSMKNGYHAGRGHALGLLLGDCETICTQWKTGTQITQTGAREGDRLQKTGDGWEKAIEEVCNGESK